MKMFQKSISSILVIAILVASLGTITGCETEASRREAEAKARAAEAEARAARSKADREEVITIIGIGTAIVGGIGYLFGGGGNDED